MAHGSTRAVHLTSVTVRPYPIDTPQMEFERFDRSRAGHLIYDRGADIL